MTAKLIAKAIKAKLVDMAINDEFPTDMTMLDEAMLEKIINNVPDEDKRVDMASNYLCDGELSVAEQLKIIEKQSEIDGSVMLDYVDDNVIVWEKGIDTFTVDEFLDLINR